MGVSIRDVGIGIALAAVLFQGYMYYTELQRKAMLHRVAKRDVPDKAKLKEHTKVFKTKEVVKVTPRIHVAIGFALANSMMIEGEDGVVIVDVTESVHAGREVLAEFRKITKKPVKGIVYTHNHADHVYGAKAFIEDPRKPPEIWAHHELLTHLQRQFYTNKMLLTRAARMFGILVPDLINAGIGPSLRLDLGSVDMGIVYPTKLMTGVEKDIRIAGVNMKLVHIPGETEDQIGVWVPGEKTLLCADDVYQAFPNLYSIRGTPTRDLLHWSSSLDRMVSLKPEFLVPSHTRPIVGQEVIRELLTGYRDAIQYVHDQTLRYMNKGLMPDEVAAVVHLPEHLATHPYLFEFYGTVEWSVKGVFNAYMGWFSGDPVELSPLTPNEMAERMVHFGGGIDKVTTQAEEALAREEYQWALVISSYVIRVDNSNARAKEVKVKSLMAMGDRQTSPNGRNYYFTTAMEEMGEVKFAANKDRRAGYIRQLPLLNLFKSLQVRWNAEECGVVNSTIHFEFTDVKESITMTTRNAVVLISDRPPTDKVDIKVTVTSQVWREAAINSFSGLSSLATGDMKIDGGLAEFTKVMGCFDKD